MQSVGVIRQLGRYPVKSMRGEPLFATTLTLQGVPADRRYRFVSVGTEAFELGPLQKPPASPDPGGQQD
jgi:uncharacterized protein YcbX